MLVTGRFGLKTYSLDDPATRELLDELTAEDLRLQGDPPVDFTADTAPISTFWQNEDMDVDRKRKLALLSRDPRAYAGLDDPRAGRARPERRDEHRRRLRRRREGPGATAAAQLPAASDRPHDHLHQRLRVAVDRRPRATTKQQTEPRLDVRAADHRHRPEQPARAAGYPTKPVDLFRRDGVTAYSHDVQVDDVGIAWVSGDGGTRGYWTEGRHCDPFNGRRAGGTPLHPIPYGGGGLPRSSPATTPAASSTTHGGRSGRTRRGATRATAAASCCSAPRRTSARRPRSAATAASSRSRRSRAASTATRGARSSASRSASRWSASGARTSRRARGPPGGPFDPLANFCSAHYFDVDGSTVSLRVVRRGHAVPGHLRSGEARRSSRTGGPTTGSSGRRTCTRATCTRPTAPAASTSCA